MSQDVEARPAFKRENQAIGDDNEGEGCFGFLLKIFSVILIFITFPISIWMCVRMVQEYQRAVIFRLGRVKKGNAVGPGLFFIIPCLDSIQEILTKDSVTVSVDAVVYYKVSNPMASVCMALHELLADRERTSTEILQQLDEATDPWGIQVERVEVKDVRLPQQLQRAMAAEAEAAREARAKVIAAEGEQKASRALKEASLIISESPSALQLRYLQTLTQIAAERNSTIIFPLPIDMMSNFMNGKAAQPATVSQM